MKVSAYFAEDKMVFHKYRIKWSSQVWKMPKPEFFLERDPCSTCLHSVIAKWKRSSMIPRSGYCYHIASLSSSLCLRMECWLPLLLFVEVCKNQHWVTEECINNGIILLQSVECFLGKEIASVDKNIYLEGINLCTCGKRERTCQWMDSFFMTFTELIWVQPLWFKFIKLEVYVYETAWKVLTKMLFPYSTLCQGSRNLIFGLYT